MESQRKQLEVTMHVYSGLPNPTRTIEEDDNDPDFQYENLQRQAKPQPQRLGYRGFTVIQIDTDITPRRAAPTPFMAVGAVAGAVAGASSSRRSDDLAIVNNCRLELKLLDTFKDISRILKEYVSRCITASPVARSADVTSAAQRRQEELVGAHLTEVEHAPPFDPSVWNNEAHQKSNNCYSYANNIITEKFPQPGRAAKQEFKKINGSEIKEASQADGLKAEAESGWNRVALAIWPDQDYHWYRLDNTGYWSHKPGQGRAIDVDDSKNKIEDPKTCDRGPYTEFICYMWTNPEKVKIE